MHNRQTDYGQTVQDMHLPAINLVITNVLLAPRFCITFRVWVSELGAKPLLYLVMHNKPARTDAGHFAIYRTAGAYCVSHLKITCWYADCPYMELLRDPREGQVF